MPVHWELQNSATSPAKVAPTLCKYHTSTGEHMLRLRYDVVVVMQGNSILYSLATVRYKDSFQGLHSGTKTCANLSCSCFSENIPRNLYYTNADASQDFRLQVFPGRAPRDFLDNHTGHAKPELLPQISPQLSTKRRIIPSSCIIFALLNSHRFLFFTPDSLHNVFPRFP